MFDITGNLLTSVNNLVSNTITISNSNTILNGSLHGQMNNMAIIPNDLRLEWQSAPLQSICLLPYIISLEANQIEIHNAMTLSLVQTIKITSIVGNATCLPICLGHCNTTAGNGSNHSFQQSNTNSTYAIGYAKHTIYIAQNDGIVVYPMVPLPTQVIFYLFNYIII